MKNTLRLRATLTMPHPKLLRLSTFAIILLALAGLSAAENRNPVSKTREAPKYPYDLRREKITGHVLVEFIVGMDGKVHDARVIQSTHPGFDYNALATIRRWTFEPGVRNGQKVNVRAQQSIDFDLPKRRPIRPFAEAKKQGTATIAYWLDENKQLVRMEVIKASSPNIGKAAMAQLADEWEYSPGRKAGGPAGRHQSQISFGGTKEDLGKFADGILKKLSMRNAVFLTESELDKPLVIVLQEPPVHPPSLRETHATGRAVVEFVIDPEGLVQWPRVVEATHEDFGYAAAQGVGQWLYLPPEHKGKPTSVLLRQTVEFKR